MTASRVLRPARKFLVTAVIALVTATGLTAATPTTATAAAPVTVAPVAARAVSPAYSSAVYERDVQRWVNLVRRNRGLKPLRLAGCTDAVAERWSAYLARNDRFYHQSMTKLLDQCNAYYAGETLGRGSITPRRLVGLWMHSPAHRHVLLSRKPSRIGIGASPNAYGEWVVAANFMRF